MSPPRKTVADYEREAAVNGSCLVHPAHGIARRVYQDRHGKLPSNVAVCHTCDNPSCILDAHHFSGSWKDNTQDAVRKGRHSGFRKGGARFTGSHDPETRAAIGRGSAETWAGLSPEERAARVDRAARSRGPWTEDMRRIAAEHAKRGWAARKATHGRQNT